jgi:hypothetical protein
VASEVQVNGCLHGSTMCRLLLCLLLSFPEVNYTQRLILPLKRVRVATGLLLFCFCSVAFGDTWSGWVWLLSLCSAIS